MNPASRRWLLARPIRGARTWPILPMLLVCLTLAGCVSIPDHGAVETVDEAGVPASDQVPPYVPRGPQDGESGQDTVTHFLDAMLASPMSATVAREFFTQDAAGSWTPQRGYLTYASKSSPDSTGRVTFSGVNRFDSRGTWVGAPPGGEFTYAFVTIPEKGQWRIVQAPDLLLVNEQWFETQTQPMSLYFFGQTARTLVPEPVFVPRGDQQASLLVRGVLEGPVDPRVELSFVPEGTRLNLGVTIDSKGRAEIPLTGDFSGVPDETVERMALQFAWTLRQVPGISTIRMTADGEPLTLPDGEDEFPVEMGASYDPAGIYPEELYGLLSGVAVRVADGQTESLIGQFGRERLGLRSVAASLDGTRIAGVAARGTQVLVGELTGTENTPARSVAEGTVDPLTPSWDSLGRLWILDRRPTGAFVSVVEEGKVHEVPVPGISGKEVPSFLVSRDGTRLLAIVRAAKGDRIVVSRIHAGKGRASVRATRARVVVDGDGADLRIRDIGWRTPTSIFYILALTGQQSELISAVVDGSPQSFDPDDVDLVSVEHEVRVLSSPRPSAPVYLQLADGKYVPVAPEAPPLPSDVIGLEYVG